MPFEESTSTVNECKKNACANPSALQVESQCNQVSRLQLQFFERSGQPRRVDHRRRFFPSVRCVAVHSARLLEAARLESTDTFARISIACTNGNRYRLRSPSETLSSTASAQSRSSRTRFHAEETLVFAVAMSAIGARLTYVRIEVELL